MKTGQEPNGTSTSLGAAEGMAKIGGIWSCLVHRRHTVSLPPSLDSDSRCLPLRHTETLVHNTRSESCRVPDPWMSQVSAPGNTVENSWLSLSSSATGVIQPSAQLLVA